MIQEITLKLSPRQAADESGIKKAAARELRIDSREINQFLILHRSIDARQKRIWVNLKLKVAFGDDKKLTPEYQAVVFNKLPDDAPAVLIVGAGPAGLFAALRAIELGIKPIVFERGKDVESRLRDLAKIQKEGKINPESNFCYGEGGAGAYSDGKLFTRSKKRGNVKEILDLLYQHGASERILFESHPHIGSDKLPKIIRNIRETILSRGGEIKFNTRFKELIIKDGQAVGLTTDEGKEYFGPVVLATGHSAADVYRSLFRQNVGLEEKGFAMGVRVEHPQRLINDIQYHNPPRETAEFLPPAEYSYSCQVDGRGVYSFCMCPGGVIVPSGTADDELVVNGMSASGRSGRWANSACVVEIRPEDIKDDSSDTDPNPLRLLDFQKKLENQFYRAAGNSIKAPAQRLRDFVEGKDSKDLPRTSYVCGIQPSRMDTILPPFISDRLKKGFQIFDRRHKGFLTNEGCMIGLESRTSSPVRIPRNPETMEHVSCPGLFPCGEGAGYAGGIVSSAIDGRRAMEAVKTHYFDKNNSL